MAPTVWFINRVDPMVPQYGPVIQNPSKPVKQNRYTAPPSKWGLRVQIPSNKVRAHIRSPLQITGMKITSRTLESFKAVKTKEIARFSDYHLTQNMQACSEDLRQAKMFW